MRKADYVTIKKMARKNILENRSYAVLLVIAIFTVTFMVATIISLCVNQIEWQRLLSSRSGGSNGEIEPIIYVLMLIGVLIMVAGFFMINNVMSMAVSKDIRIYGLLKSVGMEIKQIRKMIFRQIVSLCAIGIPLGLMVSVITVKIFVPLFLGMYGGLGAEDISVIFHPMAFTLAAIFAFFTAVTGAYAPAKMVSKLPVAEAVNFAEYGYFHKIKTSKYSPEKMACRNIVRAPGRAVKVFFGLFMGMTAFLTVSVILGSASVDLFVEQATFYGGDNICFRNGLAEYGRNVMADNEDVLSEAFIDKLGSLPGLEGMQYCYFNNIQMEINDLDGSVQSRPGYIYGVSVEDISRLSEESGFTVDMEAFERGEFVILRNLYKDTYQNTGNAAFYVGDKIMSYPVGGFLPAEFDDYFGKSYNWLPCIYISDAAFQKIFDVPQIYEIKVKVAKESQEQAFHMAKEICNVNENIILGTVTK